MAISQLKQQKKCMVLEVLAKIKLQQWPCLYLLLRSEKPLRKFSPIHFPSMGKNQTKSIV